MSLHPTFLLRSSCVIDCTDGTLDLVSLGEIAFWSLEGGDTLSCPEGNDLIGLLSLLIILCVGHCDISTACSDPSSHLHCHHKIPTLKSVDLIPHDEAHRLKCRLHSMPVEYKTSLAP